jgi:SAM-dependent methyltransferase
MVAPTSTTTTDDWNRHWREYHATAALNPAQAYRRKIIFEALELDAVGGKGRLLEIGSGQGDMSRDLLASYPDLELFGIDLSQTAVEIASAKVPRGKFHQQDLTQPLTIPEQYRGWATHAVCSEVLEHLDDPVAALKNIKACLAPGARLVITVPAGPMSAFDRHIGHRRHFSIERLEQTIRDAGLKVATLNGAGFPFFNLYRLTVVARGRRLIDDATKDTQLPLVGQAAIRVFSWLFRLNQTKTQRGWQLLAVAIAP